MTMRIPEMPKPINLKIDGKEICVPEGTTILQAAMKNDIYIPYLCYHPRISHFGACRICVVKVDGKKGYITSCSTPVEEDMVVTTNSPDIQSKRQAVLELLLVHHPLDCPVCDRPGECELHEAVYEVGLTESRFSAQRHNRPIDRNNPFIERNYNRCTLCGRCVRICSEVQGVGALSFNKRGFNSEVGSAFDRAFECESCGQCMSVCLVGSINDKVFGRRVNAWALEKIKSICPYCGVGCTIQLNVKDDKVYRVTTHHELGFNNGNLCVKGRFGWNIIYGDGRIRQPMIKRAGGYEAATWEEALELISTKLEAVKKMHGADAIGGLGSARCTNEDNYVFQKFMRCAIGTNNVDSSSSLIHSNISVPMEEAFGWGAATNTYEQVLAARVILAVGDISESHPVFGLQIQKAVREQGAKLIVMSPKKVKLNRFAALNLLSKPGHDARVLQAIASEILKSGLSDDDFINTRTEGFEGLKKALHDVSLDSIAESSGISVEDIKEAARMIGEAETVMFVFNRYVTAATAQCIINIALMTGNIGDLGKGVMPLLEFNNNQGLRDMGVSPSFLPGYERISSDRSRRNFEMAWNQQLPNKSGRNVLEMIDDINQGRVKALYMMGDNPVDHIAPGIAEVLPMLDFLVVQDTFFNEVAALADVILPASSFAEKTGTFTNSDRRVQLMHRAIMPFEDSKPDWQIICKISGKMGYEMNYKSAQEIMSEISLVNLLYSGVDYKTIDEYGVHWPCATQGSIGDCVLYQEEFGHEGKAKFLDVDDSKLPEASEDYDLDLIFGACRYHNGSISRRASALNEKVPEGYVEISEQDAKERGLKDGDSARVESVTGTVSAKVRISNAIVPGSVFLPTHFIEDAPALLAYPDYDVEKRILQYPQLKVKVVKQRA